MNFITYYTEFYPMLSTEVFLYCVLPVLYLALIVYMYLEGVEEERREEEYYRRRAVAEAYHAQWVARFTKRETTRLQD